MVTVPKPGKQHSDLFWNATSGLVKLREGQCRMCRRPWKVRPPTRHHLVPLRWFLSSGGAAYRQIRNSNANIIPICRPCHDLIEKRDPIARRMLRKLLTQAEVAFAIRLRGRVWLDREYPVDGEDVGPYEHEQGEGYCDYYEDGRLGGWASISSIHHDRST